MNQRLPIIFIFGPTAVGKTDFAEQLAQRVSGEIINMDSVQCYTPLTIGSAKPDWRRAPVSCHLFDILEEPVHSSVTQYREKVRTVIDGIRTRGNTPILVGGSGFYLMSLLYPPTGALVNDVQSFGTWDDLHEIDPVRAGSIHKNDQYRIDRALAIWHATQTKPSECIPQFDPLDDFKVIFLTRDISELKDRIVQRTHMMLAEGFMQEVQSLDLQWHVFLSKKRIIGYAQMLEYLQGDHTQEAYDAMVENIINKTAAYAKRQRTFWRMLCRKLDAERLAHSDVSRSFDYDVVNLTLSGLDLYISQLSKKLYTSKNKDSCSVSREGTDVLLS